MEGPQVGEPGEGQARIRHAAVGVNCTDTYHVGIQTQKGTLYPTQPTLVTCTAPRGRASRQPSWRCSRSSETER